MKNGWGGCSRHQTSALLKDIAAKITPRQRWSHIQCYFLSGIHLKCLWWKQNVSSKCHTFDLETKSNVVWYQLKGQKKATLATKRSFILYTTCIHLHDIWYKKSNNENCTVKRTEYKWHFDITQQGLQVKVLHSFAPEKASLKSMPEESGRVPGLVHAVGNFK